MRAPTNWKIMLKITNGVNISCLIKKYYLILQRQQFTLGMGLPLRRVSRVPDEVIKTTGEISKMSDLDWMYDIMFDPDCDPDEDMSGEAIFGD